MPINSLPAHRAVFVGCARNCAKHIDGVLDNIARLSSLFAESAALILENDSIDDTKEKVASWASTLATARLVSLDGLSTSHPARTVRLAAVRNRYLDIIRSEFSNYDYAFVLDCDDVNAASISLDAVADALLFLARDDRSAAVFANCMGVYRDMWALRHPQLCPGDIWEEVCDHAMQNGVSDEIAFRATFNKRCFTLAPGTPPIEVDSAFGGLGIYKIGSILRNTKRYSGQKLKMLPGTGGWVGWQCCEHVSFHHGFREQDERLFIFPDLINLRQQFGFYPSAWRHIIFPVGRNAPCPCGSGRRFKHCHGTLTPSMVG